MRKRIVCVVLCVVLLCSSFCVTAFAADTNSFDFFDFYFTYCNSIFYKDGIASDPDRLVDFYSTDAGKTATLFNMFRNGGVLPAYVAKKSLDGAVDSRYIAAQIDRDMVEQIYSDAALISIDEFRTYTLDELHLTTSDTISYNITVSGSTPVTDAGSEWTNQSKARFDSSSGVYSVSYLDDYTILSYPGGVLPPVLYVPQYAKLYQNGVALPGKKLYFVLGDNLLLAVDSGSLCYSAYFTGDESSSDIVFGIARGSKSSGSFVPSLRQESCSIYSNGSAVAQINGSGTYSGWSMVNLFQQMCGFILDHPNVVAPTPVMPDDIPYDDDDNVVVMVPVDEPGEPVYMSPTEYNNYVNNGDIYNTDDHSNNVVSNDTINNITNIYNTYDDSKILNKLDIIIEYLDKIYRSIKNINLDINIDYDRIDAIVNPPPSYDNFSDITAQVPLIGEVRQLITDFQAAINAPSGLPHIDFELFGVEESIRFDWYLPYQARIKNLLKGFAYLCGVIGCWLSLKSAFGINRGGEE